MEHIYHIRYEYFEKDKSIREISRKTGHARETVSKYVEQEDFSLPKPVKHKHCAAQTATYSHVCLQTAEESGHC